MKYNHHGRAQDCNVATYVEQYFIEIEELIKQAASFTANDFDLAELEQLVAVAGLRTEHFLRTAVVPNINPKQDFASVIMMCAPEIEPL
jgi:hypothetical protein